MSDELRREAASIARAVRRKVERERALGGGELLASGVARARGAEIALSGSVATSVAVEAAPAAPAAPVGFTLTPPR
jgi:hypothetical protein